MAATLLAQKLFVIDAANLQKTATVYRAVNQPLRLQIIEIIHKASLVHVTHFMQQLKLEQPVISAHLKILRDNKIVKAEGRGNNAF